MKRWALLTVLLYAVCVTGLTSPLFLLFSKGDVLAFFLVWFVPILVLIQAVLLLVPVGVAQERPVKRRSIVVSAVLGAIPMAVMAGCFFLSVFLMVWGEKSENTPQHYLNPIVVIPIFWLAWGIIFYRSFSSGNPRSFVSILNGWLLRGSILELLVAIPSHIISRHRHECCAPPITLIAIATGLSIALMSFGPAVFFLFAKRIRDKKGRPSPAAASPQ